jgi:hypothetical protein
MVEKEVAANKEKIAAFMAYRHLQGMNDIVLISLENISRDTGYVHLTVEQIVSAFPRSLARRMQLALQNLVRKSEYPGAEIHIDNLSQGSLFYLERYALEAMSYLLSALGKRGLISVHYSKSSVLPCDIVVTPDGWEAVSRSEKDTDLQITAVIAISSSDTDAAGYLKAAAKACKSNGYEVAEYPCYTGEYMAGHSLIAKLREARFLICDLSHPQPEAYFSAGMAIALNKPVIVTCRKGELGNVRLDHGQLGVIVWDDLKALPEQLSNAIRALVV